MHDTSKWDLESMWKTVIDKQHLGVKYHYEMIEIFSLIDMKGYCMWQQYRFMEESKTKKDTDLHFINRFNKIYQPNISEETLIKKDYLNPNRYSVDNKRNIIDDIFTSWMKWENSVIEMLMGCVQWCILNQCSDFLYFEELLEDTTKELRTLQEHYSKLQDSKYNISDILEWQEYIYPKYKTKLYEKE